MELLSAIHHPRKTLKRKLFGYMLLLAALLLLTLFTGLFFFGRFHSVEQETYDALDIQMDAFEKDIVIYFDHLAAASVQLSEEMSGILDAYLSENRLTMADLTDASDHLTAVQEVMLNPLRQKLLREACSGSFVLLDATVNSSLSYADSSRAGLYLQTNGYDAVGESVLLYRGPADLGKAHGMMPHRKWKLEFNTGLFPNYEQIMALSSLPAEEAYYLTDVCTLPGTSEQVLLLVVPMTGADGTFYGLCGLEVSASFFQSCHAQPTRISHLTCLLTPGNRLNTDEGLSCGTAEGYYRPPRGSLTAHPISSTLFRFTGDDAPAIGVVRTVSLSPNNLPFALTAMMPKAEYDRNVQKAAMQNVLLWLLILFFAVNCCLFFSRRFLTPILKGLEQLKSSERAQSNIPEIDDLFVFLSEKDREHEETLRALTQEKQQAQEACEKAQTEINRLSYKMKQEVDPDNFQYFLNGLRDLTPTEQKVFNLYFEGKSAKEILEILQIKENTLKFHNKGIYSKLGVNSRKQLLQYAALMKQMQ